MHEILHAYLLFEQNYPSDCDLNCLLNKYIDKYGPTDLNPTHHNLFVETKFLNDIAVELKNFAASAGYNVSALGDQYFKDMAWGGLHQTALFAQKPLTEKNRINNRLLAALNNKTSGNISPIGIKACD